MTYLQKTERGSKMLRFLQYGGRSSPFWRGKTRCSVFRPTRKPLKPFPDFPHFSPIFKPTLIGLSNQLLNSS
jgi:hypothetical protein